MLEFDLSDTINYKQWVHADRATFALLENTVVSFIDFICESFDNLIQYHFIAKFQFEVLKTLKDNGGK